MLEHSTLPIIQYHISVTRYLDLYRIHSFERVLILSLYSRTGYVEVCVESRDQVNNPP
jgi:hypothetical protein